MDSGYTCAWESKRHGSFVNNDTLGQSACRDGATAGAAEVCGLRIANEFVLFRGRDVAIAMNGVKNTACSTIGYHSNS